MNTTTNDPPISASPVFIASTDTPVTEGREGRLVPGLDKIGCGYNVVTGDFANSQDVRKPLFDLGERVSGKESQFGQLEPYFGDVVGRSRVLVVTTNLGRTMKVKGSSLSSLTESMAASVGIEGKHGTFEGSVKTAASLARSRLESTEINKISGVYGLYRLALDSTRTKRRDMLIPLVRDMIDGKEELDPDSFFSDFGGYYIDGAVFGGLIDYMTVTDTSKYNSGIELQEAVEALYEGVISKAEATANAAMKKAIEQVEKNSQMILSYKGPALTNIEAAGGLEKWVERIPDRPAMIDFRLSDLQPIWKLAETPARQSELQEMFTEWARRHSKGLPEANMVAIRGFHSRMPAGASRWYYTSDKSEEPTKEGGWTDSGERNFYLFPPNLAPNEAQAKGLVPVWRFRKPNAEGNYNSYMLSTKKVLPGYEQDRLVGYAPSSANDSFGSFTEIHYARRRERTEISGGYYGPTKKALDGPWNYQAFAFYGAVPQEGYVKPK